MGDLIILGQMGKTTVIEATTTPQDFVPTAPYSTYIVYAGVDVVFRVKDVAQTAEASAAEDFRLVAGTYATVFLDPGVAQVKTLPNTPQTLSVVLAPGGTTGEVRITQVTK